MCVCVSLSNTLHLFCLSTISEDCFFPFFCCCFGASFISLSSHATASIFYCLHLSRLIDDRDSIDAPCMCLLLIHSPYPHTHTHTHTHFSSHRWVMKVLFFCLLALFSSVFTFQAHFRLMAEAYPPTANTFHPQTLLHVPHFCFPRARKALIRCGHTRGTYSSQRSRGYCSR